MQKLKYLSREREIWPKEQGRKDLYMRAQPLSILNIVTSFFYHIHTIADSDSVADSTVDLQLQGVH